MFPLTWEMPSLPTLLVHRVIGAGEEVVLPANIPAPCDPCVVPRVFHDGKNPLEVGRSLVSSSVSVTTSVPAQGPSAGGGALDDVENESEELSEDEHCCDRDDDFAEDMAEEIEMHHAAVPVAPEGPQEGDVVPDAQEQAIEELAADQGDHPAIHSLEAAVAGCHVARDGDISCTVPGRTSSSATPSVKRKQVRGRDLGDNCCGVCGSKGSRNDQARHFEHPSPANM